VSTETKYNHEQEEYWNVRIIKYLKVPSCHFHQHIEKNHENLNQQNQNTCLY